MMIPRKLSSILFSVAGLCVFLIIASQNLVSQPKSANFRVDILGTYGLRIPIEEQIPPPPPSPPPNGPQEKKVKQSVSTKNQASKSSIIRTGVERADVPEPSLSGSSDQSGDANSESCDLYRGKWIYDPAGPLYTNDTCPIITATQNCQGNGRPDKEYENWRWKPDRCDLPRFDARKFLEIMRGKTIAFVGDSLARNQMESLICILWQVEVPKNRGNRRMHRWYFRSTSTMIVRIWSSWLVHHTTKPVDFASEGVTKLHLDTPDEDIMQHLASFDVLVISSGHWFGKRSVYLYGNKIVGGQQWRPDKDHKVQTNHVDAYGIASETIFSAIATHPNHTGLTIVRSYTPDHYEGGSWNTGGSCTGKTSPATMIVRNGHTDEMHKKQVDGFEKAMKKARKDGPKLKFMDITDVFGYRHDGHPGPYRNRDPNKKTQRGPKGQPPPQDCLHWCMPGPVDTWNELMMEIIRRQFQEDKLHGQTGSSPS